MKKLIWLILICPVLASAGQIRVEYAHYGANGQYCNALPVFQDQCNGLEACQVRIDKDLCGDPAYRQKKSAEIHYFCGGHYHQIAVGEDETADLRCQNIRPESRFSSGISIAQASYGAANKWCNATEDLIRKCNGQGRCVVHANNRLCGDPARNRFKELWVNYYCDNQAFETRVPENQSAELVCLPKPAHDRIQIERALYGYKNQRCDVADELGWKCNNHRSCTIRANDRLCGDPAPNRYKNLKIRYRCGQEVYRAEISENQKQTIGCMQVHRPAPMPEPLRRKSGLNILKADFGLFPSQTCSAYGKVSKRCNNQSQCTIKASNRLCGDPARNRVKHLRIEYQCHGGPRKSKQVIENKKIRLNCP